MKLWRYGVPLEHLGNRFRLDGVLGSGGMADVCLAWDERDQREVAIKVIKPNELDQRTLDRFLKEASQVARWRHPHVLRIYGDVRLELLDVTQGSIVPYIVMEYAQHGDLHKRLRPGVPFAFAQTLWVFEQLCQAVSYAHSQGIIHRDLKPLNILFRVLADGSEQMALSDFGLAVEKNATHFTFAAGGTLPYMAPEQLRGRAEAASDIFALGVILYQLCTGHLPFRRSIVDLHRREPLPPPALPSQLNLLLPVELDAIILTALADDPLERYADALDFWDVIQAVISASTLEAISYRESLLSGLSGSNAAIPGGPGRTGTIPRINIQAHSQPSLPRQQPPQYTRQQTGAHALEQLQARQHMQSDADYREAELLPDDIDQPASQPHTQIPARSQLTSTPRATPAHTSDPGPITYPPIEARASQASNRRGSQSPNSPSGQRVPGPPKSPQRTRLAPPQRAPRGQRRGWRTVGITMVTLISLGLIFTLLSPVFTLTQLSNLWPHLPGTGQPAVTVTLVPHSQTVTDTSVIQGVTTTPQAAQLQIASKSVKATSQSQPQTIPGTGHTQTKGTVAKGMLTFFNGAFITQTIGAGTEIIGKDGIKITIDNIATLPAANPAAGTISELTVNAHATNAGAKGNIGTRDIDQTCCTTNNSISVRNLSNFTGGQDPQDYNFVRQSDVDAVINPLVTTLTEQAQSAAKKQLAADEQLVNPMVCPKNVTVPTNTVGDKGHTIASIQVSVTVTCSGTSYNQKAAQALATMHLKTNATKDLGDRYALEGSVNSTITSSTLSPNGSFSLLFTSTGKWTYQIDEAQKQRLLQLVVGQPVRSAQNLLKEQNGIDMVFIHVERGSQTLLPDDATMISIQLNTAGNAH